VKDLVHAHVLSDFARSERAWVETLCDVMAENAGLLAQGKEPTFQNKVHLAMTAKGFGETKEGKPGADMP
jgi:PTH1 family peptidyl-tRNA hydrolase